MTGQYSPLLSRCALLVNAFLWSPLAFAGSVQDPFEEPDEAALFRAEQRVVTVASRYAQTIQQAPSIVTLISDEEIRERGYRTLSDVLRGLPGVYVAQAKEGRDLGWFRGVISPDNNKFLLLVNGVPWYDGVYTHAWLDEYVPLEHVRQIEVIKGPGSALYGTNAFAGVVNVVTYRADELQGGFLRAVAGSDGRQGLALVYADRLGNRQPVELRASARWLSMEGLGVGLNPEDRYNISGTDPRESIHGSFGFAWRGLEANVDFVDYTHTYFTLSQDDPLDVLFQDPSRFAFHYYNQFAHLRYNLGLGGLGDLRPYLYAQRYDNPGAYAYLGDPSTSADEEGNLSTELTGTLVLAEKRTDRYGGGVEAELHPHPDHTTAACAGVEFVKVHQLEDLRFVDFSHDPELPSGFEVDPNRDLIWDAFACAQHTWTASWWMELTAGGRYDQHSFFGSFVSPRAGLLLVPMDEGTIKLLYGRAFRAPNARELLVLVGKDEDGKNEFVAGNPSLRPEVINTVEGELRWSPKRNATLRAASYYSRLKDEINTVSGADPKLGDLYYANSGSASILGAEAEGELGLGRWDLGASYAWTRAEDSDSGLTQYEFPPHMAHGRATFSPHSAVRLTGLVDVVGSRPRQGWSPDAGLKDGPAYALVHMALSSDFIAGGRVRADLSVQNLLNTDHDSLIYLDDANAVEEGDDGALVPEFPSDIAGPGRSVVVGIEARL